MPDQLVCRHRVPTPGAPGRLAVACLLWLGWSQADLLGVCMNCWQAFAAGFAAKFLIVEPVLGLLAERLRRTAFRPLTATMLRRSQSGQTGPPLPPALSSEIRGGPSAAPARLVRWLFGPRKPTPGYPWGHPRREPLPLQQRARSTGSGRHRATRWGATRRWLRSWRNHTR